MAGGSAPPTRLRAGVPASLNSLTLENDNYSHAETDIAAHPGGPAGESGNHPPGISNLTRFSTATSQRSNPDHVLDNPENFDDAPYMPPRIPQAELQTYPALDPRSVYDPQNHDIQHVRFFWSHSTQS